MYEITLYEEVNCIRGYEFCKYRRVTDPFFIEKLKKGKSHQTRISSPFENSISFNIKDDDIFWILKEENLGKRFLINRYKIEWKTRVPLETSIDQSPYDHVLQGSEMYFYESFYGNLCHIENKIIVFNEIEYFKRISYEDLSLSVKSVKRNLRLNKLMS
jgi:hypothetical protein